MCVGAQGPLRIGYIILPGSPQASLDAAEGVD